MFVLKSIIGIKWKYVKLSLITQVLTKKKHTQACRGKCSNTDPTELSMVLKMIKRLNKSKSSLLFLFNMLKVDINTKRLTFSFVWRFDDNTMTDTYF